MADIKATGNGVEVTLVGPPGPLLRRSGRMADIKVTGNGVEVTLMGPDDDGDYWWACTCGERMDDPQPIADIIADAEVHVDIDHRSEGN